MKLCDGKRKKNNRQALFAYPINPSNQLQTMERLHGAGVKVFVSPPPQALNGKRGEHCTGGNKCFVSVLLLLLLLLPVRTAAGPNRNESTQTTLKGHHPSVERVSPWRSVQRKSDPLRGSRSGYRTPHPTPNPGLRVNVGEGLPERKRETTGRLIGSEKATQYGNEMDKVLPTDGLKRVQRGSSGV